MPRILLAALVASSLIGLEHVPSAQQNAPARQPSAGGLQDRFVGTWKLAGIEQRNAKGEVIPPAAATPPAGRDRPARRTPVPRARRPPVNRHPSEPWSDRTGSGAIVVARPRWVVGGGVGTGTGPGADEEVDLSGDGRVVRIGGTVHRAAGPWTPSVQALLGHASISTTQIYAQLNHAADGQRPQERQEGDDAEEVVGKRPHGARRLRSGGMAVNAAVAWWRPWVGRAPRPSPRGARGS